MGWWAMRGLTLCTREQMRVLGFGQLLSVLIACTGITSTLLARLDVNIPTAQSFLNYALLGLVYTIPHVRKHGLEHIGNWKYALLALADVEANYLVVRAYQYTSLASVMLLDCWSIPIVMGLSWLLFRARYDRYHYSGVGLCILGVATLCAHDYEDRHDATAGSNPVLGDALVLAGATLYGFSNVGQEAVVKHRTRTEYLAMLGLFGTVFNGIQLGAMDHAELSAMSWGWREVLLLLGFALSMFAVYSLVPVFLRLSNATLLNLSLLTADVLGVVAGVAMFAYAMSILYVVAFVLIIAGIVLFHHNPTDFAAFADDDDEGEDADDALATPTHAEREELHTMQSGVV